MNKIISNIEFCSSYIILSVSSILGIGFYSVLRNAKLDSYISVLISFLIHILLLTIFFKIWNYEPNLPIYDKTKKIFGSFVGNIINIILLIFCFNLLISGSYNFLTFINSQIFPETPIIFIGIICLLVALYLVSKKINTIFRISTIITIINSILFFIAAINLIFLFDKSNLLPILKDGIFPVFKGSLFITFQTLISLFALLIIPKNKIKNANKLPKKMFISCFFIYFLLFLITSLTIGNLGIYLAREYTYPEYMVLKNIEMFGFLDRIENVLTIQWIFGYLFTYGFLLYYIKDTLNNNFYIKTKYNIELYISAFIILIIGSYIFKNDIFYAKYIFNYSPYFKICFISILFIIFIFIIFKKKKKVV